MAKNKVYRQGSVAGSGYKGLEVEGGSAKNQQNKVNFWLFTAQIMF